MNQASFSILVNSCDAFEDCWTPFFTLLHKEWPTLDAPIYLVTEKKEFTFPPLNIRSAKVQVHQTSRLTWSECFIKTLEQIETDLVLYFQEDYFIEAPVDGDLINQLASKMQDDPTIKCIGLTHFGPMGPFKPSDDERLVTVNPKARYRISTQAALWRKETLLEYLRPEENGWMFEIYGTRRAWKRPETFLNVDPAKYGPNIHPVLQYTHTGIIKGKWHPAMPELFTRNSIPMDFEKRGFHVPKHRLLEKLVTLSKLAKQPLTAIKGLRGL